jgi:hypothetical protein
MAIHGFAPYRLRLSELLTKGSDTMSRKLRSKRSDIQRKDAETLKRIDALDVQADQNPRTDNKKEHRKLQASALLIKIVANFISIALIFRRFTATIINTLIATSVILLISYLIGSLLFFLPNSSSYIEFKWFYVVFAVLYGTFGNLGWFTLPPIGGKLTKLTLRSRYNQILIKFLQYFARNSLYIAFPAIILFFSPNFFSLIKSENRGLYYIAITIGLFFVFFSVLFQPISIIVGKGKQGVHDKICGLIQCSKYDPACQEIPWKNLLYKSTLWSAFLSILLTVAFHSFVFGFNYDKILFPGKERDKYTTEIENLKTDIEKTFKAESLKHKKTDTTDGFTWWVNLEPDVKERIKVAEEIGLKDLNKHDLLGYGIKIYDTDHPIDLIELNEKSTKTITNASTIFSIFVFVDAGIFYKKELQGAMINYFVNKAVDANFVTNNDVIRVKFIRLVKAGFIKLGFFDELYLTPGKLWRSKEQLYSPLIFDLELGNQYKPAYLNPHDFR